MFQLESEDLIPRWAPKPSSSDIVSAHPSVPEISIVFTQKQTEQHLTNSASPGTSYSVWKNKCLPTNSHLPQVDGLYNEVPSKSKKHNVYPLRVIDDPVMNSAGPVASNNLEYSARLLNYIDNSKQTECSAEAPSANCIGNSLNKQKESQVHAPTLSTGTQTDDFLNSKNEFQVGNFATKKDIVELKTIILRMESEQRNLLESLNRLLEEKVERGNCKLKIKDAATQSDHNIREAIFLEKTPNVINEALEDDISIKGSNENCQNNPNIQSSQSSKITGTHKFVIHEIPKSEQSIAMNELAIKYVSNKKLNSMAHKFPMGSDVKNQYEPAFKIVDESDKNPNDLSTASYKYLQKYRLLPEENYNSSVCNHLSEFHSQNSLLDLDIIRYKPKFL